MSWRQLKLRPAWRLADSAKYGAQKAVACALPSYVVSTSVRALSLLLLWQQGSYTPSWTPFVPLLTAERVGDAQLR